MKVRCPECGAEFPVKGIATHKWRKHGDGREHKPFQGIPPWNRGLRADTDERVARNALAVSKAITQKIQDGTHVVSVMGAEARERISRNMTEHNPGGRCSWFLVGEEQVQGSWERDLAVKMTDLEIVWGKKVSRGNRSWFYSDKKGIRRWYTPDFYLPEFDFQLEVKGFWWGDDREKMDLVLSQNETRIKIIEARLYHSLLGAKSKAEFLDILGLQALVVTSG